MSKRLKNRVSYLIGLQDRLLTILAELIISKQAWIELRKTVSADRAVNDDFRAGCFRLLKKQDQELTMTRSAGSKLNSKKRSLPHTQLISFIYFQGDKPGLNNLSVEVPCTAMVHT